MKMDMNVNVKMNMNMNMKRTKEYRQPRSHSTLIQTVFLKKKKNIQLRQLCDDGPIESKSVDFEKSGNVVL